VYGRCDGRRTLSTQSSGVYSRGLSLRKKAELGDITVPPNYGSGDFKKAVWWSLRGKLDVPKERWGLYPGVERNGDPSPVIAWAGWDHAQQAQALAAYYIEARQTWAFAPEKLRLLLAGQLLPWLQQWHSAVDPSYGVSPAESIEALLVAECHELGLTRMDLETTRMSEPAPAPLGTQTSCDEEIEGNSRVLRIIACNLTLNRDAIIVLAW
jgi:hypothetical protein